MKVRIGLLIILFIFHSLSDFAFKKRVLKNKFGRAQKLNLFSLDLVLLIRFSNIKPPQSSIFFTDLKSILSA